MESSNHSGATLVWDDLAVSLPNRTGAGPAKKLVQGLSGYATPGRILALMGPSGSGKSTLLDSLAGRLASNVVVTGTVLLNGRKRRLDYGVVAYVTQENTILGTMTVRETMTYSAHLRFPTTKPEEELKEAVEETIGRMGLSECADRPVGNWHLRGISGGEKKRLCIGLEMLTQPPLLFLDEPTSGLDTASAHVVALTLKQMAVEGKTVVTSVHQPNSDVFVLFDDLCLLSGGEMVYFGDVSRAMELFEQAGFGCPPRRNPSDHFLRCINTDFDGVNRKLVSSKRFKTLLNLDEPTSTDPLMHVETTRVKSRLIDCYKRSKHAAMTKTKISELSKIENTMDQARTKGSQATWPKQLTTLTARSFANMSRDYGYYRIRLLVYILLSLCVGSLYFSLGTTHDAIQARSSSAGFVFAFMAMMSIGGFPSFIEEMKVFTMERLSGHYGVLVFVLSNFVASAPYLFVISLISSAIMYFMVGLHPGFGHFVFFTLNLYGSLAFVEGVNMMVASLVPNFLMGIGAGSGVLGIMMLAAGYLRLLPDLPKPIWRYPISYISFTSWALQGQYKNDMLGLEFGPVTPGGAPLRGEDVVEKTFGVSLDHSKWFDLGAIFVLVVSYRLLFFVILKLKERRASSRFSGLIRSQVTLYCKYLNAIKKKLSRSSKHDQSLHPTDSQEETTRSSSP